jgi:hypothetical protein
VTGRASGGSQRGGRVPASGPPDTRSAPRRSIARARVARRRRLATLLVAGVCLGAVALVPLRCERYARGPAAPEVGGVSDPPAGQSPSPLPSASANPSASPAPLTLRAAAVTVPVDGFLSWALLDRRTGGYAGSANITATNSTESMIKIWIVADALRRAVAAGRKPTATELRWARAAIRDSDDASAENLFDLGNRAAVIRRLVSICGLTDTWAVVPPGESTVWWSYTQMSARDAVRMGACIGDGRAAGSLWTPWVFGEMASVRGTAADADQHETSGGGRWGIIDGLPDVIVAQGIGIKNGWTLIDADDTWRVDCLAVHADWVLAVLLRYPARYGLWYGADACKKVAQQLVTPASAAPG